jgi:hypothetical protein
MFRDRTTGRVVIGQWPNVPLALWLVCLVIGRLAHPHGDWSAALSILGTASLVVWAGDEIARGVNPWRRVLGAVVLVALVLSWAMSR